MDGDHLRSPTVSEAMRDLVRSERMAGRSLLIAAFGEQGGGGLGLVLEDGIEVLDRRPGRGLTTCEGTILRIVHRTDGDGGEGVAAPTWLLLATDGISGETRTIFAAPDLHDVHCSGDDVLVSAGSDGRVLRCSPDAIGHAMRSGGMARIEFEVSLRTHGIVRGIADDDGRAVVTVSNPGSGQLVDVETGAVLADGLDDPIAVTRSERAWLISDLGTNELVIDDDDGRRSIALGGLGRGMIVRNDVAYVVVGRPAALRRPVDRHRYRIVIVDLDEGRVVEEQRIPLSRPYTIRSVPTELANALASPLT